jgi:hypothetical protein
MTANVPAMTDRPRYPTAAENSSLKSQGLLGTHELRRPFF